MSQGDENHASPRERKAIEDIVDDVSEVLQSEISPGSNVTFLRVRTRFGDEKHFSVFASFDTAAHAEQAKRDGTVDRMVRRAIQELELRGVGLPPDIRVEGQVISDDETAAGIHRARTATARAFRGLDTVERTLKQRFVGHTPLTEICVVPGGPSEGDSDRHFGLWVFFSTNESLLTCVSDETLERVISEACDELERAGRGDKNSFTITVRKQSDENLRARGLTREQWMS